ncbi:23839_t:CDS:2 [Gigaspora rosea]|nr:23839_t:CDS:2 [Gigaspora rosea]
MLTHIHQKFYRSNATHLSESDIIEIRESRGKIPNASKRMAEKFHIGTHHVYEIWEHNEQVKKETILSETSQETEDPLEFYKRTQKEIKKVRADAHADISKVSTSNLKV